MPERLKRILAPPVFEGDEDKTRTARLLTIILWTQVAIALAACLSLPFSETPLMGLAAIVSMAGFAAGMLFLVHAGRVRFAAWLFSTLLWLADTIMIYLSGGVGSPMAASYVLAVVIAALLLGERAAIAFAGLSIVSSIGLSIAELQGLLPEVILLGSSISSPVVLIGFISLATVLLYLATNSINEALSRARRYATELEEQRAQLEDTVNERTTDLARRSEQLATAAQVARDAAAIQDIDQMLAQTAGLISERFGFYHTGIFLLDPSGEWAILQAASSPGGQQMLARGHRLRVGLGGIVGHVAGYGQSRIARNVGEDAVFFDNPDLPDTRSELALPLRVRDEVIGVLDVQSVEMGAFADEDVAVLQTLADQVAIAISNARLLQQAQASLEAERRAFATVGREAWSELVRSQPELGYRRTESGFQPAGDLWRPQMVAAMRTGETTVGQRDDETTLSLPVKWRDQIIGVIDAQKRDEAGGWTPDEVALVEAVVEQVGVALESARLHQDTERRAAREEMFGEMTARIRETLDMESVLRTTAHEVRQALGLPEVVIRLANQAPGSSQDGTG